MIVDDDHIILGSANLNERSQRGSRDTEIAVEAYQPYYATDMPRGQIYHFRQSLWAEHTATSLPVFMTPEHLNCVRQVR
jgi:phospholipase D1/2